MTSTDWRKIMRSLPEDQGFLTFDSKGNVILTTEAEKLLKMRNKRNEEIRKKNETKMDTKKYISGNNLRAEDLGEEYKGNFVIDKEDALSEQTFDGDVKLVLKGMLENEPSNIVLNQTNLRRIQEKYGYDSDDWNGKKLVIVTEYVSFQGKDVLAVRVKK